MTIAWSVSKVNLLPLRPPLPTRPRALARAGSGLVMFVLLFASLCRAQGTYTAASSAESDVIAVINGPAHTAVNGDVIQIPCSGTQSVTWTSALTVTANITITALGAAPNTGTSTFGSGTNCLTIRDDVASGALFTVHLTYASANNVFTLQDMNIDPFTSTTPLTYPISVSGTCSSSGCPNIRIANIILGNAVQWNENGNGNGSAWMIVTDNVFGVLDHITLPTGSQVDFADPENSAYLGIGAYGDNSWTAPDSFGGANNLYLENNSIYVNTEAVVDCEEAPIGGAVGGCRYVARYNHVTLSASLGGFGNHGLDTDGRPRSGREIEVYGNTVTCILNSCGVFVGTRGGTQIVFGNTLSYTGTGFFDNFTALVVYRTGFTAAGGWGACGNTSSGSTQGPFDTNDGITYYSGTTTSGSGLTMNDATKSWTINQLVPAGAPYSVFDITQNFVAEIASNTATSITIRGGIPEQTNAFTVGDSYQIRRAMICADQGGRGAGLLLQGSSPVLQSTGTPGAVNETLDPTYEWSDSETIPVRLNANIYADTGKLIANRDYYTDNWFPGLTGPKAQTSATAPFNGTTTCNAGSGNYTCGVGFGTVANRPASCTNQVGYFATDVGSQGTLYQCQDANWVTYYTPYTYPHPLTTGTSTTSETPNPPTDLTAAAQ